MLCLVCHCGKTHAGTWVPAVYNDISDHIEDTNCSLRSQSSHLCWFLSQGFGFKVPPHSPRQPEPPALFLEASMWLVRGVKLQLFIAAIVASVLSCVVSARVSSQTELYQLTSLESISYSCHLRILGQLLSGKKRIPGSLLESCAALWEHKLFTFISFGPVLHSRRLIGFLSASETKWFVLNAVCNRITTDSTTSCNRVVCYGNSRDSTRIQLCCSGGWQRWGVRPQNKPDSIIFYFSISKKMLLSIYLLYYLLYVQ